MTAWIRQVDDQDPLAVVAVDVDAGQQADDEARDRRDHQRQADGERRPVRRKT